MKVNSKVFIVLILCIYSISADETPEIATNHISQYIGVDSDTTYGVVHKVRFMLYNSEETITHNDLIGSGPDFVISVKSSKTDYTKDIAYGAGVTQNLATLSLQKFIPNAFTKSLRNYNNMVLFNMYESPARVVNAKAKFFSCFNEAKEFYNVIKAVGSIPNVVLYSNVSNNHLDNGLVGTESILEIIQSGLKYKTFIVHEKIDYNADSIVTYKTNMFIYHTYLEAKSKYDSISLNPKTIVLPDNQMFPADGNFSSFPVNPDVIAISMGACPTAQIGHYIIENTDGSFGAIFRSHSNVDYENNKCEVAEGYKVVYSKYYECFEETSYKLVSEMYVTDYEDFGKYIPDIVDADVSEKTKSACDAAPL